MLIAKEVVGHPDLMSVLNMSGDVGEEGPLPLREARARHDNYIGVEHLVLALVGMNDGAVPPILSALGTTQATLRAAILDRYRRAS